MGPERLEIPSDHELGINSRGDGKGEENLRVMPRPVWKSRQTATSKEPVQKKQDKEWEETEDRPRFARRGSVPRHIQRPPISIRLQQTPSQTTSDSDSDSDSPQFLACHSRPRSRSPSASPPSRRPLLSDKPKIKLSPSERARVRAALREAIISNFFNMYPLLEDPRPGREAKSKEEESGEFRRKLSAEEQSRKEEIRKEWLARPERNIEGRRRYDGGRGSARFVDYENDDDKGRQKRKQKDESFESSKGHESILEAQALRRLDVFRPTLIRSREEGFEDSEYNPRGRRRYGLTELLGDLVFEDNEKVGEASGSKMSKQRRQTRKLREQSRIRVNMKEALKQQDQYSKSSTKDGGESSKRQNTKHKEPEPDRDNTDNYEAHHEAEYEASERSDEDAPILVNSMMPPEDQTKPIRSYFFGPARHRTS